MCIPSFVCKSVGTKESGKKAHMWATYAIMEYLVQADASGLKLGGAGAVTASCGFTSLQVLGSEGKPNPTFRRVRAFRLVDSGYRCS